MKETAALTSIISSGLGAILLLASRRRLRRQPMQRGSEEVMVRERTIQMDAEGGPSTPNMQPEELSSDMDTPMSSETGGLENMTPQEALKKVEAQNQKLWTKLGEAAQVQKENAELQAELVTLKKQLANDVCGRDKAQLLSQIEDLKFQVIMAKSAGQVGRPLDHEGLINELRESNKALAVKLEEMRINEQHLTQELQELSPVVENDKRPSRNGKVLDSELATQLSDLKIHSKSVEEHCSRLEAQSIQLNIQVQELENERAQIIEENLILEEQLVNSRRKLTESEEAQSYLASVVEDLQNQLDACSPDQVIGLRGMVQRLEGDNNQLQADMEVLSLQLRNTSSHSCHIEVNPPVHEVSDEESYGDESVNSEEYCGGVGATSMDEPSEKLVDLSEDIVTEMANVGTHANVELTLSSVQYAGLLSVVQKAIKQMEQIRNTAGSGPDTFTLLDQTLSRSLSITNCRVHVPQGAMDERVECVHTLIEEKLQEVAMMKEIFEKLRDQVKGQRSLSLPQEVQLEYLTQHLSSTEKVIKLSWEVEGLRKGIDESKREVEALREQSEQQQRELTIQWQSKQQALAETQAHHHEVSSVSQQIEHLTQANENLQNEKAELERDLEEAREEVQELTDVVDELHENEQTEEVKSPKDNAKAEFITVQALLGIAGMSDANARTWAGQIMKALSELREAPPQDMTAELSEASDVEVEMEIMKNAMNEEIMSLQADLQLSESFKQKFEQQIVRLQEEAFEAADTLEQTAERYRRDLESLEAKLAQKEASAASEIEGLQETLKSYQDQLQHYKEQIVELTSKLEGMTMADDHHEAMLQSDRAEHRQTRQPIALLDMVNSRDISQSSIAYTHAADAVPEDGIREAESVGDVVSSEVDAWKIKAANLVKKVGQLDSLKQEIEQLKEQLSLKEAMWESERRKSDGLIVERTKAQKELSSLQLVIGRLEHSLEISNAEIIRLNELLDSERQQYSAAARAWEDELDSLTDNNVSRDSWPPSVRRLVENCEQITAQKMDAAAHDVKFDLEQQIEDAMDRLEAIDHDSAQKLEESNAEKDAAVQKLEHLEGEMKNREVKLQEKLKIIEESASMEKANLESEVATLRESLARTIQEATEQSEHLSYMLDDKCNQLMAMQERARAMMIEKDKEIAELKTQGTKMQTGELLPVSDHIGQFPVHIQSQGPILGPVAEEDKDHLGTGGGFSIREKSVSLNSAGRDRTEASGEPSGIQDTVEVDKDREGQSVEILRARLKLAEEQVRKLELEMQDSEQTHALRDKANSILKEEIAELQRVGNRDGVDVNYLKNILVSAFEKGSLPKDSPMVDVLARLLHFSPKEIERIEKSTPAHTRSASRGLFPVWGR